MKFKELINSVNNLDLNNSDELLNIFKKENIEIITASDAHKPSHVGSYIKEATLRIGGK